MKTRIVWKRQRRAGEVVRRLGPMFWAGGTCENNGQTLGFDDLPGTFKTEGGRVLFKGRNETGFQDFCSLNEVAAIIGDDGRQIYQAAAVPAGK